MTQITVEQFGGSQMIKQIYRVTAYCERDILQSNEIPELGHMYKIFDHFFSNKEAADMAYIYGKEKFGLVHGIHWHKRTHFIDSQLYATTQMYDIHEALRRKEEHETEE